MNGRNASNSAGFDPWTSRPSLSDLLSERVLDLIRNQQLATGDRLPSVRAMADQFSVAAPTMREALRRLQASGIVEIRHGSGVYIRDGHDRLVLVNPYRSRLDAAKTRDLLEARLLIEPYLVGLAASRMNNERYSALSAKLAEAKHYLAGNDDAALSRANMKFHAEIGRFSGNAVLSQALGSLLELYSGEQEIIATVYDDRERDHQEHLGILDSLGDGNADLAVDRMRSHLEDVKAVVCNKLDDGD